MQKKNLKQKKPIKQIILFIIAVILLLLLIFAEDIIKLTNKNKINLAENSENELIMNEPNIPELSAGMIPVKYENGNWRIIAEEDEDTNWYDYENGQPAYVMLNNGTYQSEFIPNMTNKELAEENIGEEIPDNSNARGSIYMWIPRFAYKENGEIGYIKEEVQPGGEWVVPEIFSYIVPDETSPDFSLSGVWVEKDVNTAGVSTITEMQKEEGIYGFIADTKPKKITSTDIAAIQNYITNVVWNDAPVVPMANDITNTNRIILQVVNINKLEPIKAKGEYNKETETITVQVAYANEISKIMLENEHELNFSKIDGVITANTLGIDLKDGYNTITIIDNKGNKKELRVRVMSPIYATLYTDGTLAFGRSENPISTKTKTDVWDISENSYTSDSIPWYSKRANIKTVEFVNEIKPTSTANWFSNCSNLTLINNMSNLDTSNVTSMRGMFFCCSKLTTLNSSSFDTSNVTDMVSMFSGCSKLTTLDVSSFDTSNVTSMISMFNLCSSLTSLDISNFNTSNVTDMKAMFMNCSGLTTLDVSSFDTSNVTDMTNMFCGCTNLKTIYVNRSTTMWSDSITNSTTSTSPYYHMFYACGASTVTRK